jgi:hypothetical protein
MKRLAFTLLLSATGCAVQLGGHGGVTKNGSEKAAGAFGSNASMYVAQWQRGWFFHAGTEVNGEVENDVVGDDGLGTYWTGGIQVGPTYWPRAGIVSLQTHFDLGIPMSEGPYDGYLGGTFAVPIELNDQHNVIDMNETLQFVARRISLVPFVRYRTFWTQQFDWHHNVAAGFAVRARLSSDLL